MMSDGHIAHQGARDERESVFLHASVLAHGGSVSDVFRVRNISRSGLMGEGPVCFTRGEEVDVELRNIGKIHGKIVWANERRFGLAFDHLIDPKLTRKPSGTVVDDAPKQHKPIMGILDDRRGFPSA